MKVGELVAEYFGIATWAQLIDLAAYILFIFIISCLNCCPFCFSFGYLRCGLLAWCPGIVTRKNLHLARLSLVWRIGVVSWCRDAEPSSFGAALWRGLRWRLFWPTPPHPVCVCLRRHTDNLDPLMTSSTDIWPASKHNHRWDGGRGDRKLIARGNNLLFIFVML